MRGTSLRFLGALAAVTALAGALSTALAFLPQEGQSMYEIPLLQVPPYEHRTTETLRAGEAAAALVGQRYGGDWRVHHWNSLTNTPAYLIGSGAQVAGRILDDAQAEALARQVIAENAGVFKVSSADLRFLAAERALGKVAVHFQQTYQGIDVWQGAARLTFTEGGRLFVMGSECYQGIALSTTPSLSADQAEQIAATDIGFNAATDLIQEGTQLLVLPVPVSDVAVEHHLVWRVRVEAQDPFGIWVTHVDAHTGAIVWRFNDVHFLNFVGDATHDVEPATYCVGLEEQDLKHMRVQISGVGETTTAQDGSWTIPYAGTDARTVTANFYGPYIRINVQDGTGNAQFSQSATPGVPLLIDFNDSNARRDERDCFDAINDIHDFYMDFAPTFSYVNQRITCNVGVSGSCNAFWNGTINFYNAGGGCANTGQIQGVVHHEFGHGITNTLLGSQGNEGIGEGNSDIIANLLTQESIIGRGFYLNNCTSGIRNSQNTLRYPEDLTGSIHHDGQIIAGFHWDFMQLMQGLYGTEQGTLEAATRWHHGRVLQRPVYQPAQVLATFIADDDDGNLNNGTPHYDQLCEAAQNHGFDCPEILVGVLFDHAPLWSTEVEGNAEVVARIWSTESPLVPSLIKLNYQVDGGAFQEVVMTATGNPDEYHAFIPNLTQPTEVGYYLSAQDQLANFGTSPRLAPASLYEFNVALVADQMEVNNGWVVNLEGTDNATTGLWVRVDPVGTDAQPEDDHTSAPGTICWVTGNGSPGGSVGENDVDGGTTTVYSVAYDITDALAAKVVYWRWYSNDKGADPNNDIWVVQVRNNGGAWVDLERNQLNQNQWVRREFDLGAILGANLGVVQFKFVASDLNSGSIVEAAVDDFDLLAQFTEFSSAPETAGGVLRYALHGSTSNPIVGATEFRFQVPVATEVELALFDVSGRAVAMLAKGSFRPGAHTVAWDGKGLSGQPVAAGVYYARLHAGEYTATRPVVLSR